MQLMAELKNEPEPELLPCFKWAMSFITATNSLMPTLPLRMADWIVITSTPHLLMTTQAFFAPQIEGGLG